MAQIIWRNVPVGDDYVVTERQFFLHFSLKDVIVHHGSSESYYKDAVYVLGFAKMMSGEVPFFISKNSFLPGVNGFVIRFPLRFNQNGSEQIEAPSGIWLNDLGSGASHFPLSFDICSISSDIFVAITATTSSKRSIDFIHEEASSDDLQNPFGVILKRIKFETLETIWAKTYFTSGNLDASVNSIAVTENGNHILLAGSTRGAGDIFGGTKSVSLDLDGFLTRFNSSTGEIEHEHGAGDSVHAKFYTTRIKSNLYRDDKVEAMCYLPTREKHSNGNVLVVGTSDGLFGENIYNWEPGTQRAFAQLYDVDSFSSIGGNQVGDVDSTAGVEGLGCTIFPGSDGNKMDFHILGNLEAGARLSDANQSQLGTSIFVSLVSFTEDSILWSKQFQFEKNSSDIVFPTISSYKNSFDTDNNGNILITGSTSENIYRKNSGVEDAFLMKFNIRDLSFSAPLSGNLQGGFAAENSSENIVLTSWQIIVLTFCAFSVGVTIIRKFVSKQKHAIFVHELQLDEGEDDSLPINNAEIT